MGDHLGRDESMRYDAAEQVVLAAHAKQARCFQADQRSPGTR